MSDIEKNYHVYEAKRNEVALYLGFCTAKWSQIEGILGHLFAWGLDVTASQAAEILIHVRAFALLSDITNAVVKRKLDGSPYLKFWNSLVEYIRELSGDRNFLIHSGITAYGEGHPAEADWAEVEPKVGLSFPYHFTGVPVSRAMDAKAVNETLLDIDHALGLVNAFMVHLRDGTPSPHKFDEPVTRRRPPRKQRQASGQK